MNSNFTKKAVRIIIFNEGILIPVTYSNFVSKSLHNLSPSVFNIYIHRLVFPQISITMKPQVLHRVTSQNFFIRQIDMKSIQ